MTPQPATSTTIVIHQTPRSSVSPTVRKTRQRPAHRLSRLRRAKEDQLPPFRLTPRDIQIIRAVYEYRAITTVQLERLFFTTSTSSAKINPRCQHRLKLLYHAGHLDRHEQPVLRAEGSKPLVYFLDKKGAERLAQQGIEVDWDPDDNQVSHLFLDHHLATNDLRIALAVAGDEIGATVTEWRDEKRLKSPHQREYVTLTGSTGVKRQVAVVPDGYFVLTHANKRMHHFLEIDRGTETVSYTQDGKRDWAHKIKSYLAYYHSGAYEARYGTRGMRILTVTTGAKRMQHLKEATEKAGGKSRFWFTAFEQATPSSILTHPIWSVAGQDGQHSLIAPA